MLVLWNSYLEFQTIFMKAEIQNFLSNYPLKEYELNLCNKKTQAIVDMIC